MTCRSRDRQSASGTGAKERSKDPKWADLQVIALSLCTGERGVTPSKLKPTTPTKSALGTMALTKPPEPTSLSAPSKYSTPSVGCSRECCMSPSAPLQPPVPMMFLPLPKDLMIFDMPESPLLQYELSSPPLSSPESQHCSLYLPRTAPPFPSKEKEEDYLVPSSCSG